MLFDLLLDFRMEEARRKAEEAERQRLEAEKAAAEEKLRAEAARVAAQVRCADPPGQPRSTPRIMTLAKYVQVSVLGSWGLGNA